MTSDASKIGFGATFGKHWIQSLYPAAWSELDITVMEISSVGNVKYIWSQHYSKLNILYCCDNIAVCFILNKLTISKHTFLIVTDIVC